MSNVFSEVSLEKNLINNIKYISGFDQKLSTVLESEREILILLLYLVQTTYLILTIRILFDSIDALVEDIDINSATGRKIASVRVKSNTKHTFDIESLDRLIIDKHDSELLDYLPCFSDDKSSKNSKVRDILFLGSLQALTFCESLSTNPENFISSLPANDISELLSVTIVESNISHLLLFISFIDLADFTRVLKSHNIQLNFVFALTTQEIIIRLFDFYTKSAMTALLGLKVFTFPYLDNQLRRVESWMFSQAGLGFSVLGSLGSFTDELNQVSQHLINITKPHYLLRKVNERFSSLNCIVTGSGPSLDLSLINIQKLCEAGSVLIAGGSSIKSLLKNNIVPDFLVLLERGSEVYDTIYEISQEFNSLSQVTLIASSTVDPRLSSLFHNVVYFNRPLSSSLIFNYNDHIAALPIAGPESANAALEVAGSLGFKNIMLFGLDFSTPDKLYTRSKDAYDHTPREYNVPQKGNKGRTVYSQDSLISARDSVEKAIQCFPASKFQRFGEGLVIKNSEEIQNIDQAIKNYEDINQNELYLAFRKDFMLSNFYVDQDTKSILSKLQEQIRIIGDLVLDPSILLPLDMKSPDKLHSNTASFFNAATDINSYYSFCSRLLRQPIFYMLSTVYDSEDVAYHSQSMVLNTSLSLLLLYAHSYLKRQYNFLNDTVSLNDWNPSMFSAYT